jgi:hypothetical protein
MMSILLESFVPPWSNGITCSTVAMLGWLRVSTITSGQHGQGRPIRDRIVNVNSLFFDLRVCFIVSP